MGAGAGGPETKVTFRGVIYPWQLDHMGHMNVQHYTALFDQATWVFFSQVGMTASYMREHQRGMAALVQRTEYKREVFAGDVVEVETHLLAVTEKTMRFLHTMRRQPEGEVVATSELVSAHLNRETHRSVPFPEEIRAELVRRLEGTDAPA